MPQKYYNVKEAATMFGVPEAEVKQMIDRRELHGYRDGADWKFKAEEIDRLVRQRAADSPAADDDDGDVLLSEVELGHSDPGLSGTVIGTDKALNPTTNDIRLADSDVRLAESGIKLADSGVDLTESKKAGRRPP